jgi:hypothetical protein
MREALLRGSATVGRRLAARRALALRDAVAPSRPLPELPIGGVLALRLMMAEAHRLVPLAPGDAQRRPPSTQSMSSSGVPSPDAKRRCQTAGKT